MRAVAGYFADREAGETDRLIYERVRLGILSALSVNQSNSFAELKELLQTTDGNLSIHARKLEEAAYIECSKFFRGRVPRTPERSWEPERVQLMAQGLLLREHGYRTNHGMLYFAGSRTRVTVPFTPELEALTRRIIADAKVAARRRTLPDPLEDSPKCNGCSLSGICLPDEVRFLTGAGALEAEARSIARLFLSEQSRNLVRVFFLQNRIGKDGETFRMIKFRTMFVEQSGDAPKPRSHEDPRLTHIGRWLRRYSLDELPQVFNVLLGDMSIVGPRPEMQFIVDRYGPLERERLRVKPGVTGL